MPMRRGRHTCTDRPGGWAESAQGFSRAFISFAFPARVDRTRKHRFRGPNAFDDIISCAWLSSRCCAVPMVFALVQWSSQDVAGVNQASQR